MTPRSPARPAMHMPATRADDPPRAASAPKPRALISALALLAFYTSIDISVGAGSTARIPNLIGAMLGLLLLAIHYRRISPAVLRASSLLVLFFIVSCSWAVLNFDEPFSAMLPVAQFGYTLAAAYGMYLDLSLWRRSDLNRVSGIFAAGIIIGSVIEVYTPFNQITLIVQQFHERVSGVQAESLSRIRDVAQYGQIRPRLFCSETSYVAINFGIFASMWLLTLQRATVNRIMLLVAAVLIGLYVIRSPFCVLPVMVGGLQMIVGDGRKKRRAISLLELALFVIVSFALIVGVAYLSSALFSSRLELAQAGTDWSVTVRTYGAMAAGWNVAMAYPLFGVGAGNFDAMRDIVINTYIGFNVPDYVFTASYFESSVNNGIATNLAYFGVAGAIVHIMLWLGFYRRLAPRAPRLLLLGLMFLIYNAAGNIYSPKGVWPTMLLVVAAASNPVRPRKPARQRIRPGVPRPLGPLAPAE